MIEIKASAHQVLTFPAELPIAYAYYGDVGRVLPLLPHISIVRAYGPDRFRLLFDSTEFGSYRIRIFADVQTKLDRGWEICVHPLDRFRQAPVRAGVNSAQALGRFHSHSAFYDEGDQTRIEYSLQLEATLPTPTGLRFMPGIMVNRTAKAITNIRIREIAEGFIERSTSAFPHWLEEFESAASPLRGND